MPSEMPRDLEGSRQGAEHQLLSGRTEPKSEADRCGNNVINLSIQVWSGIRDDANPSSAENRDNAAALGQLFASAFIGCHGESPATVPVVNIDDAVKTLDSAIQKRADFDYSKVLDADQESLVVEHYHHLGESLSSLQSLAKRAKKPD